jgi:hypothetical protein
MTARAGDPIGEVSTTATLGELVVQDPRGRGFTEGYGSSDDLPACCQGWLAEQTHRHYHHAHRRKELS